MAKGQITINLDYSLKGSDLSFYIKSINLIDSANSLHARQVKPLCLDVLGVCFDLVIDQMEKDSIVDELLMRPGIKLIPVE